MTTLHVGLRVEDRLALVGIDAQDPTSPDGSADFRTTWLADPDGYRTEVVQWPTGQATGLTRADFPDTH